MASLANQTISSTYDGLIKTSSDNAVGVSGVQLLQDGSGNDLALSVGRSGNGVTITGSLNATSSLAVSGLVSVATNRFKVDTDGSISLNAKGQFTSPFTSSWRQVFFGSNGTLISREADNFANLTLANNYYVENQGGSAVNVRRTGAAVSSIAFSGADILFASDSSSGVAGSTTTPTEKMRIDSSGRVGINDTVSGSIATNYNPKLLVGGTIVARSLTSNEALIEMGGDATSAFITSGKQDGSQTARALRFEVGTSEAMRIDSSGVVQVKNDAPTIQLYSTDSSLAADQLIGTLDFYKSDISGEGAGVSSSIQVRSENSIGSISYMSFHTDGGSGDQNAERMRILSSGGITFNGDTAAANALDDYEEGTFTPIMSGYSGVTYSSQIGHYTKIGRFVQVSFYMSISNIGTYTGNSYINGFPFSLGTSQAFATGGQLNIMTALNVTRDEHFGGFYNGTSNLFIYSKTGLTTYNGDNHQAGIYSGTLTYFV